LTATGPSARAATLARLADETFDAIIVGGGATGAAIARDAALRGLAVAICDSGDFASQTSSHSSKLIHGGLRYLQYGDLPLVFEGLAERHRLLATAPHLCRPIEFLFPAYLGERPSLPVLSLGVTMYDALALWRAPVHSRRVPAGEVYTLAPDLRTAGLQGAQLYVDCQTDDTRLVLENALDAEQAGAVLAPYVHLHRAPAETRGHLRTLIAEDRDSGERFAVRARAIVNCAGPFSDDFRGGVPALRPTLGVHVVVDADRLPTDGRAIVIHSPRDGRLLFTLPAGRRTIIGTTDTDWAPPDGPRAPRPADEIRARGADVDYLIEAINHAFPPARLTRAEIVSTFAGLRPLIASGAASTSATSREHEIWVDRQGVLTVAGGKLTTMRSMGEEAVDRLVDLLRARGVDRSLDRCTTRTRPLPGAVRPADLSAYELGADVKTRLANAYGARAGQVAALAAANPALSRRLTPDLPYLRAEITFAVRHDHALEIEDVLRRRVPLFRDAADQGLAAADETGRILADELGWSPARRARSAEAYRRAVEAASRWRQE
jgi:glycerol-3-phosphate dehydrogenase